MALGAVHSSFDAGLGFHHGSETFVGVGKPGELVFYTHDPLALFSNTALTDLLSKVYSRRQRYFKTHLLNKKKSFVIT